MSEIKNDDIVYVKCYGRSVLGYVANLDDTGFFVKFGQSKSDFIVWFIDEPVIRIITKKDIIQIE